RAPGRPRSRKGRRGARSSPFRVALPRFVPRGVRREQGMGRHRQMRPDDWFLTADERGNPDTDLDRSHPGHAAWTEGNTVRPLVHGRDYFERLHECLQELEAGDLVMFADWRGDADEPLAGPGTEFGRVAREL